MHVTHPCPRSPRTLLYSQRSIKKGDQAWLCLVFTGWKSTTHLQVHCPFKLDKIPVWSVFSLIYI